MKTIQRAAKWLLFRPPLGLRHDGEVVMKYPRRIEGARYIRAGARAVVCEHSWIAAFDRYASQRFTPRILVGQDVGIGRYACITAIDLVEIGDGSLLSEHVYLSDDVHQYDLTAGLLKHQPLLSKGPVRVGRSCFLGYRVAVLPGVELGDHCGVGANSVVARSFPAYSMLAGAPARLIRRYDSASGRWQRVGSADREAA